GLGRCDAWYRRLCSGVGVGYRIVRLEIGFRFCCCHWRYLGCGLAVYWVGRSIHLCQSRARNRRLRGEDTIDPEAAARVAAADQQVKYRRSLLTPSWILAVLCSFFGYWTFTVATTWLPAYFENVMGASTQQSGSLIALPAIWGAIATVGLSWLTEFLAARGMSSRYSRGFVLSLATV